MRRFLKLIEDDPQGPLATFRASIGLLVTLAALLLILMNVKS